MRDATHKDIMKKAKAKYNLLMNSGNGVLNPLIKRRSLPLRLKYVNSRTSSSPPKSSASSKRIKRKRGKETTMVKMKSILKQMGQTSNPNVKVRSG